MLLYYITDRRQFAADERAQRQRLLEKIAEAARGGVDFIQLREKDLCPRELEELAYEVVHVVRENSTWIKTDNTKEPATDHWPLATRLLINSRTDIALACGADGVHLTSTDIPASDARALWCAAVSHGKVVPQDGRDVASYLSTESPKTPTLRLRRKGGAPPETVGTTRRPTGDWPLATGNCFIAVSCHTPQQVRMAEAHGADFAVFAPVFEKVTSPRMSDLFAKPKGKDSTPGVGLDTLREACTGAPVAKNVEGVEAGRMPVLALGGVTLENARACVQAGAAGIAAIRLFQENDITRVVEQLRKM